MRIVTIFFDFLLYILLICILGAPLILVILFPGQAAYVTDIGKTLIPWICLLILAAIYSDGMKGILSKIADAFGRLKTFSAGGATVELNPQELITSSVTSDQTKQLYSHIEELTEQKAGANNLASHFFIRYVAVTIYGTQFRFIEALEVATLPAANAVSFYNQFVSIAPQGTDYPFNRWIGYLLDNFLVKFNPAENTYEITLAAKNFLNSARSAGLASHSFVN
jgi:hypothetical protein